jgi:outer membrane lipoprotein-sorting protein
MKRLSLFILIIISLISCSSQKTADDVINDYIKAIGGRDALDSIQTIYVQRELVHEETNRTSINTSYQKRPNMRRFGALDASNFIATDGSTVWQVKVDSTSKKPNWTEMPVDRAKSLIRNSDFFSISRTVHRLSEI